MSDRWLLISIALLCAAGAGWAKSARTWYTDDRLAAMAENLERYAWARAERDSIIARADAWARYDDQTLVRLAPPLEVARCNDVHSSGCPIHGDELMKYPGGLKSWKMSFDEPYKLVCPVGGESYPANDFWQYLQTRDPALLTGEYVDDGFGCTVAGHEKKFWFVGFYAGEMTRRWLLPALRDLSQAYLLTGDAAYAHKCALLLHRLARYYPDYFYEKQSRYGLEFMPSYRGRLQYHTWECFTIQDVALAYDAIWPAIAEDTALQAATGQSDDEICAWIEDRILRVAAGDIIDGSHRIQGNYGMHQSALLRCALVLDSDEGTPSRREMLDWLLVGPEKVSLYTDTPIMDALINLLHRDGVPFESPSYNCGWMTELEDVAELLRLQGVDLWAEPRFRGLYLWPLQMLVGGAMTQPMGDSNNMFAAALGVTPTYLQRAWERMGAPRQAAAMVQTGGEFRRDLFAPATEDAIRAAAEAYADEVGVTSELLPGLGYVTLQTGSPGARLALALNYGYYPGHQHFDRLNLEVYGYDHPLIPDLGYPETADTFDPRRSGWLEHSAVHNVVMVNARKQATGFGAPVTFHPEGWAQLVEARGVDAYPGAVEDYRRACLLVSIDDTHAYVLDLFRVVGGAQHDWLIHGNQGDFTAEGVQLPPPREQGTLAGPDVPYGQFYDDPTLIEGKPGTRYHNYQGSAFQWLFNVQEAPLTAPVSVTWRLNRDPELYPNKPTAGIGLRVHLLAEDETLFVCDGIPQRRPNFPETLKWVVRRRTGEEGLASTFASVFEPFHEGTPVISTVDRLPIEPEDGSVAVLVTHPAGRDLLFWTPAPTVEHQVGPMRFTGRAFATRFDAEGQPTATRMFDAEGAVTEAGAVAGGGRPSAHLAQIDYDAGIVRLDAPILSDEMAGRWVTVDTTAEGVDAPAHVTAVRIERVLDPSSFALAGQDLRCGVAGVVTIDEAGNVFHDRTTYFITAGMTLLDERGEIVGRLRRGGIDNLMLTDRHPTVEDFPDADGDGRRRFTVMAIGPGDTVTVPTTTDW